MAKKSPYQTLDISLIEFNDGQIEGLAKNPRYIREDEYNELKKSIEEAPEFLEARSLLVYPYNGKYVTIAGNMRLKACLELGFKELPCYVFPEETPVEKLREYTIKDNIQQGKWDWELLGSDWQIDELQGWGLDCSFLINEDMGNDEIIDKPKEEKDLSDDINIKFIIEVDCNNEDQQRELYDKLIEEGYECRILTL